MIVAAAAARGYAASLMLAGRAEMLIKAPAPSIAKS